MLFALSNCRQATFLLEKQAARRLPLPVRLWLRVHLGVCVYCRRYARQTQVIAHLAHAAPVGSTARLPENRKAELRALLGAGPAGRKPPAT